MLLYFLINFDIVVPHEGLRYPHPPYLDIAVLYSKFAVKEQKRISFADIDDTSDETLLQSWKSVFEVVMSHVSQTEERVFIFPSKSHLELFHIIKHKTGFQTQSKSNAYFKSHKSDEDTFF